MEYIVLHLAVLYVIVQLHSKEHYADAHTCMHTDEHICKRMHNVQMHINACVQYRCNTYRCSYMQACRGTVYRCTYMHAYRYRCSAYQCTYRHAYRWTYVQMHINAFVQMHRRACVQMHVHTCIQTRKASTYTGVQCTWVHVILNIYYKYRNIWYRPVYSCNKYRHILYRHTLYMYRHTLNRYIIQSHR